MSNQAELIEVAVVAAVCALIVGLVRRSIFGRRLVAMSDSPAAFATVGLSSVRTKVIVFSLSAAMAGLGGVFYAGQQGGIGADGRPVHREPDAAPVRRHLGHPHA